MHLVQSERNNEDADHCGTFGIYFWTTLCSPKIRDEQTSSDLETNRESQTVSQSARNECIESTSSVVSLWHSPPCPTTAPLHDMTVRKSAKITSTHWQLAGDIFSPEMTLNSLRPEIFFCCFLRANILRKTVFSKILITWKKTYDKKPSAAYKYCY
jgi:hypothetical protein